MDKISCDVARDLLPLYCDDVCSRDSRQLLEDHLKDCQKCRSLLEIMKTECRVSLEQEQHNEEIVKDMASVWRKSIIRSFIKGIVVALCICILLIGSYWVLTRWDTTIVPFTNIEIIVENETNEYIAIHLEATDGKKVYSCPEILTEDGKIYIAAKRSAVSSENGKGENWAADIVVPLNRTTEQGNNIQVNEIYYGTENDSMLIWQK